MAALPVRGEVEAELDEFEVPVAELAPEELVDGVGGFVEAVGGEGAIDFRGRRRRGARRSSGFSSGDVLGRVGDAGCAAGMDGCSRRLRPRSSCMKRKRAAFQILLAKAR